MFGVGPGELVIIGVLFLVIFGPDKVPQMARDIGRFTNEARRAIEDFKEELTQEHDDDYDEDDYGEYQDHVSDDYDDDEKEQGDDRERDL